MGYVSLCTKALIEDKELPDVSDPKTWMAAAIKGGGLGLFADFIFSEYDRYGNTFMQEVMGPIPSEFNSIASIYTKYKYGDPQKASKEIKLFIKRNALGRNLFYLEPAMRYWNKEF